MFSITGNTYSGDDLKDFSTFDPKEFSTHELKDKKNINQKAPENNSTKPKAGNTSKPPSSHPAPPLTKPYKTGLKKKEVRTYFTVGSTKDEVLSVQGTPTEFADYAWKYGLSAVYFDNRGRVRSWEISPLNRLSVRMK